MKAIKVQIIGLIVILCFGLCVTVVAARYNSEVYKAQKMLKELGYNPGKPDGRWGKSTETAVKQFQRDHGLSATGMLDEKTKLKMESLDKLPKKDIEVQRPTLIIDSLYKESVSKLDFGIYKSEVHLESHLNKMKGNREESIGTPIGCTIYYSSKKNKIVIRTTAFASEKECFILQQNNEKNKKYINSFIELGVTIIRNGLAVSKDGTVSSDDPTFLTKMFFPSYWERQKGKGWYSVQENLYRLFEIEYHVMCVWTNGNLIEIERSFPLLGPTLF